MPSRGCQPRQQPRGAALDFLGGFPVHALAVGLRQLLEAGQKARFAKCATTMLSFPPENRMATRSKFAAASRSMKIASASNSSRPDFNNMDRTEG